MAKAKSDLRKDPKVYMKLAVEVMKKSKHEKKKTKPSPSVGAVLVFPDGTVQTAFRGEARTGDHAEYTLLDKKYPNKSLDGCWLFATLEPCAPGSRTPPKLSCSERIVNARIAEVWFGIEDKNPTVDHAGIDYLLDNDVKVHQFHPEFHKEIEEFNKEFMTWAKMKNDEANTKTVKTKTQLDKIATTANLESLSEFALIKFIKDSKRDVKPGSAAFLRDLKKMELLEQDSTSKIYIPTGNAILLFGKSPRYKYPQSGLKAKVHYADKTIGAETFDDALVLIPDKVDNWLRKVLPASIDRTRFKAKQVPNFPIPVIREAVINALAHRDYSVDGAKVQLDVFDDRIVVKSPGSPAPPITIEAMRNFTATSYSRNKKLSFIFNEMGYMEETAIGMDTFKSVRAKYKLPLPIIEYDGLNVVVSFPRNLEAIKKVVGNKALGKLTEAQLEGYEWIKLKGEVSARHYSAHFDIGYKTAQRHLTRMRELKLIRDNGKPITSRDYKYMIR